MAANAPVRKLECDCGYVAEGNDDDELVADVQAHAEEVHGMRLSAELVVALAHTKNASLAGTPPADGADGADEAAAPTRGLR